MNTDFRLKSGHAFEILKGEDMLVVEPLIHPEQSTLFLLCDGHGGAAAAEFVSNNLAPLLQSRLPERLPSSDKAAGALELDEFAGMVRAAVCDALILLEQRWRSEFYFKTGNVAGTTVTLALVTGSLITVANLGDSEAVLDTGCSIIEMTQSHRFQDNSSECQRMRSLGSKVASLGLHLQGPAEPGEQGVGPLRCWPGGLCVGRGIGDGDAGPGVLPLPHIKQVLVPEQGCRVILASDGLWDSVSLSKAVRMVRSMDSSEAAQQLVRHIMYTRFTDDTSVLILDMLPVGTPSFSHVSTLMEPYMVKAVPKAAGLFACLSQPKEKQEPNAELIEGPAHLRVLISIDMLKAKPELADPKTLQTYSPPRLIPKTPKTPSDSALSWRTEVELLSHAPSLEDSIVCLATLASPDGALPGRDPGISSKEIKLSNSGGVMLPSSRDGSRRGVKKDDAIVKGNLKGGEGDCSSRTSQQATTYAGKGQPSIEESSDDVSRNLAARAVMRDYVPQPRVSMSGQDKSESVSGGQVSLRKMYVPGLVNVEPPEVSSGTGVSLNKTKFLNKSSRFSQDFSAEGVGGVKSSLDLPTNQSGKSKGPALLGHAERSFRR